MRFSFKYAYIPLKIIHDLLLFPIFFCKYICIKKSYKCVLKIKIYFCFTYFFGSVKKYGSISGYFPLDFYCYSLLKKINTKIKNGIYVTFHYLLFFISFLMHFYKYKDFFEFFRNVTLV